MKKREKMRPKYKGDTRIMKFLMFIKHSEGNPGQHPQAWRMRWRSSLTKA